MRNIMNDKIKVGDKFKGEMNGAIFKVIDINSKDGVITYEVDGEKHNYGLAAFKRCLLEKIN